MNSVEFVICTLADPTAPEGEVRLLRLPALVQDVKDNVASLTVFSNALLATSKGSCFLLENVALDATQCKAPSYALHAALPAPAVQDISHAQTNSYGLPTVPQGVVGGLPTSAPDVATQGNGLKVFGKGTLRQSVSHRRQTFRSAGDAIARGEINPEAISRFVPKAAIAGQKAPRIFVKGKGEITKPAPAPTAADALTDILGPPPADLASTDFVENLTDASAEVVMNGSARREASGGRPL